MGIIREDVCGNHFRYHSEHRNLVKPFILSGFNVTWANEITLFGTNLSYFFIQPEENIKEGFGLESEILLVESNYKTLEPRTIQAINTLLNSQPAKGRVDNLTYMIVTNDINAAEWISTYKSTKEESRIIVSFLKTDVILYQNDSWYVRNQLSKQYFGRDLFDNTLPLTQDNYFFGRQQIIANYHDSIKRGENKGIFGLRKTGKTSLLFKLRRIIEAEKMGIFLYFDCKMPLVRNLRWFELLNQINEELSKKLGIAYTQKTIPSDVIKGFLKLIEVSQKRLKKVVIAFDEIEYISYKAKLDKHWEKDYIDFWQVIWSTQSQNKTLVVLIAGVNPSVVEESTVFGIQNPLFGIIGSEYLKGFNIDEIRIMIKTLGKRMGLSFEADACEYLLKRYGGHPLLVRLACSITNRKIQFEKGQKPIIITKSRMVEEQESRDADLTFYCNHVISELQEFYHDEYQMLEYLAIGMVSDFIEMSQVYEYVRHLYSYGLVEESCVTCEPEIAIPVIGRYVALELAKKEKRKGIFKVVAFEERAPWLDRRIQLIKSDFRLLEKLIQKAKKTELFGLNSFPEADNFSNIKIVTNLYEFTAFINVVSKCFVESIENYGSSINKKEYFWKEIKTAYPALFSALERIKIYRNDKDHLILNTIVNEKLIELLNNDFFGENINTMIDPWFSLQQKVLDSLLASLQIEIEKIS